MIRARSLQTNATIELDPNHPVIIAPQYLVAINGELGVCGRQTDGRGQMVRRPNTPEAITALSWATDFPHAHAFVRTDTPYNESEEEEMIKAYADQQVWGRCSLKLL